MVNKYDTNDDDFEVTEDEHHDAETLELEDEEERGSDKLKQLRHKLQKNDEEKRHLMETMQRERADFLNARKRLEGERALDKQKHTKKHVEALLPLCDSFEMALRDKEAWEKADASWRKGIEGIHGQLNVLPLSVEVFCSRLTNCKSSPAASGENLRLVDSQTVK